ncbi:MAG: hypothetical protein GX446_16220 [Chthonomonadales bacterium]|nr:hypothetical protein [Chthonomonadales bacterium]
MADSQSMGSNVGAVHADASSVCDSAAPSIDAIEAMIGEAASIVKAAEQRRSARRELRTLIETIEREAALATTEEDYAAADWLRLEAKRLRKSVFGAVPSGAKTAPVVAAPASVRKLEPPAAPVHEAPMPMAFPASGGDLAHWLSRWNEVERQLDGSGDERLKRRQALDVRAVLCGVHAYVVRMSDDPRNGKDVKTARDLRTRVATRLRSLDWPWEAPTIRDHGLDDTSKAAGIRRLSDCYCRASLACQLFDLMQDNPSATLDEGRDSVRAALATMLYLQAELRSLRIADDLVDALVGEMELAADSLGITCVLSDECDAETPPYTSRALSALIERALPEPAREAEGPDDRNAAIQAILDVAGSREDFGADPLRIAEDRAAILPLVDEAFRLGVPPSNKLVRDVILERWPAILNGQGNYTVFRREVDAEIARRAAEQADSDDADAADEDHASSSDIETLASDLRPILAGKRMLLLGGVPRVHTAPKLQAVLGLEEVLWPEAKKADTPAKFETDMRKADVIVIVKNYSRHAASHAAASIAEETGGHCVMLPAGYGVAQIISHVHRYFETRGMIAARV